MSNLSAFPYIQERSEATPGLFNLPLSIISANIAAIDSGLTSSSPSGNTFSFLTNIETSGGAHFQFLSVGSTPPSYVTTAAITVRVNSATSDYLYLTDSAAQKSSYVIGSRAGGLSDGLNIWDASAGTMIASFSKQSIRFFQNVVGPVFDVGGALASTYNAATFGTGLQSTETRLQAAINQASIDSVARVYIPANMVPFSASSISFIHTVQLVREGGDWGVYDLRAYGAYSADSASGATNQASVLGALNAAKTAGGGTVYVPLGAYRLGREGSDGTFLTIDGSFNSITVRAAPGAIWQASSSSCTYIVLLQNSKNFSFERLTFSYSSQPKTRYDTNQKAVRVTGCTDFAMVHCEITGSPQYGLGVEASTRVLVRDSYVHDTMADGLNFTSCQRVRALANAIQLTGDDCIAINTPTSASSGSRGENSTIVGNVCRYSNSRGIVLLGEDITVSGNNVADTSGANILVLQDYDTDPANPGRPSRNIAIAGNTCRMANTVVAATGPNGSSRATHGGADGGAAIMVASVASSGFTTPVNTTHQNIAICGNAIADPARCGIIVQNVLGATVSGNVIANPGLLNDASFNAGIYATQGSFYAINGNSFVSQPSTLTQLVLVNGVASASVVGNMGDTTKSITVINSVPARWDSLDGRTLQVDTGAPLTVANEVIVQDGSRLTPGWGFNSERSLGLFRSGASVIVQSYGSFMAPSSRFSSMVIAGVAANLLKFTPSADDGSVEIYGSNAADNAVTWQIINTGGATFAYVIANGDCLSSGRFRAGDGSTAAPSHTFENELALGLYRSGASHVGLSYGGISHPDGSNSTPSVAFSSNTSLGFYSSGVQTIAQSYGTFDLTAAIASLGTIRVKSGANNSCGTAVLGSNGSVNVANTYVKTGDLIFLTDQTPGGTLGDLELGGIRNSSGFTIQSTSVTDTSTVGWLIIRPG